MVQEIKEAVQFLRETGASWINERKKAVQNGEDVPMDILTQILKSAGNFNWCTHTCMYVCMYVYTVPVKSLDKEKPLNEKVCPNF